MFGTRGDDLVDGREKRIIVGEPAPHIRETGPAPFMVCHPAPLSDSVWRYHNDMSLAQLLKHVKALPARQRKRLLREILVLEDTPAAPPSREGETRVTWPDVEAR